MRRSKSIAGIFILGLLGFLTILTGSLPAACITQTRGPEEAFLCFTPANASLAVGDTLQLTATLQPNDVKADREWVEKSGWTWAWQSSDGGEVEFSPVELQWSGPSEGIYVAQVQVKAKKVGTVSVEFGQPEGKEYLSFKGQLSCIDSCIITITETWSPW